MHPQQILDTYSAKYKGFSLHIDNFRAGKGKDLPDWPDYCFLPFAAWVAIVTNGAELNGLSLLDVEDTPYLATVGTWRYTKGIYRVDDRIAGDLARTNIKGQLPIELFFNLPEWCVYFDTRDQLTTDDNQPIIGFFALLEHDVQTHIPELRIVIQHSDERLESVILLLKKGQTIEQCLADVYDLAGPGTAWALSELISPIVSYILFICQSEPDASTHYKVELNRTSALRYGRKSQANRIFEARKSRQFAVGEVTANAIAKAMDGYTGDGTNKKPHLRRAHWHGFWSGARTGERKFSYKWVAPIFVNSDNSEVIDD